MIKRSLSLFASMTPAGRAHGIGGAFLRLLGALLVGIDFGIVAALFWQSDLMFFSGVISALAFSLGHGNFYEMKGAQDGVNGSTPEKLEKYLARPLWNAFTDDAPVTQPIYSWWCMGWKWFLVGLPVLPIALAQAIFAPAAYALSYGKFNTSAGAEWLTTLFAALIFAHISMVRIELLAKSDLGRLQFAALFSHGAFMPKHLQ